MAAPAAPDAQQLFLNAQAAAQLAGNYYIYERGGREGVNLRMQGVGGCYTKIYRKD